MDKDFDIPYLWIKQLARNFRGGGRAPNMEKREAYNKKKLEKGPQTVTGEKVAKRSQILQKKNYFPGRRVSVEEL